MKKYKIILITVLIIVFLTFAIPYGLSQLAYYHYTNEYAAALGDWQREFPNAFSLIEKKFGDDLEIVDVKRWGLVITCNYSTEFENKYNVDSKPTEEFLQDVADEWFECFYDELVAELESNYTDFKFPVSISFKFENGSQYELLTFSYEDFDKCNIIRHEKW